MGINYEELDEKWQNKWNESKVFEAEPDGRKQILITAAWPYPNTALHIGHFLTYGTTDTYAKYMRMKGYNVLFPMGFHKTGTPVLAIAKRITAKEEEIIDDLTNIYHISMENIEKMSDPNFVAQYFSASVEHAMKKAGFGIDWRRKFTSIDPLFSKMVEWQFYKLKEKGYLVKGNHYLGWCPNENNAVGQHDTKHDVQPEIERIVMVKFRENDSDAAFACATYRPETLYGVTNLFINENEKYVLAEINGDKLYISKKVSELLSYQFDIKIIKEIEGNELKSKMAINPITNEVIPLLHGFFVKPDFGTGIVMSVPAHAPFDYVALKKLEKEGIAIPKEPYKQVIEIRGESDKNNIPSLVHLALFGWNDKSSSDIVEKATKELYKKEARNGYMTVGDYAGMDEPAARTAITEMLKKENKALDLYVLINEEDVYCRCGTRVVVKQVNDQWFIDYGNKEWKEGVRNYLDKIRIYPEKMRHSYKMIVDWLDMKAAERAQGLGTKFPFNPDHIIESLSDSTIYMSFYTFSNILHENNIKPENLKGEFFDYVFNSKGDLEGVSKTTGIDSLIIDKCKKSLDYWYTFTSRHSASELIPSHLTMYIFNHVALFPEKFWPKQIVTNGMVIYEGEKMSKSLGNVVPLTDALKKYGADPLRMNIVANSDLGMDSDFREASVNGIKSRIEYLFAFVENLAATRNMGTNEGLKNIDFWLYSRLSKKIKTATELFDDVMIKSAYDEIFYNSVNELKRYNEMGGSNKIVLEEYITEVIKMLTPVMPHISEELWHMLGNNSLIVNEKWPVANESLLNPQLEVYENIIDATAIDITHTIDLTSKMQDNKGKKIEKIKIIIASEWKLDAYNVLAETKKISEAITRAGKDKEKTAKFLSQFKNPKELVGRLDLNMKEMQNSFNEVKSFFENKFNSEIVIESENESTSGRSARALPQKPSIEIIWK
ncbi:MAG: leucine--tRNA ligase [Candidatus Marsarchaeota archaeon]|nr:leucine--tRNA ligase [Candidatus Marsarchaeota archaeon]